MFQRSTNGARTDRTALTSGVVAGYRNFGAATPGRRKPLGQRGGTVASPALTSAPYFTRADTALVTAGQLSGFARSPKVSPFSTRRSSASDSPPPCACTT
jgi:hypothetical protein